MTDPFIWLSALLAGTSLVAWHGWRHNLNYKRIWRDHAKENLHRAELMTDRAIDVEYRLASIERQRHEAAKKARATQIARQRAKIAATTAQLQREIAG